MDYFPTIQSSIILIVMTYTNYFLKHNISLCYIKKLRPSVFSKQLLYIINKIVLFDATKVLITDKGCTVDCITHDMILLFYYSVFQGRVCLTCPERLIIFCELCDDAIKVNEHFMSKRFYIQLTSILC